MLQIMAAINNYDNPFNIKKEKQETDK